MKDYYKILEVNENSSEEEIKKSYRSLSKKYHPDVNPQGAEKFKEIAEAYEILSDVNKREHYNRQKNNPHGFTNIHDIFSQMFGDNPIFNQKRSNNAPDKIVKVQITPIESFNSVDKTIQYARDIHCEKCNGSGGEQKVCSGCKGQGYQVKTFGTGFMIQQVRTACGVCGGKGFTIVNRCYYCEGSGKKQNIQNLNVKIPHGIDEGQFLKLEGLGDFYNGNYGNLIIQIQMTSKDGYEKMNNDLIYTLYLDLNNFRDEKYSIPHPEGEIVVSAPKIFDTSKPLRIRGRGYTGGDMYVKLNLRFER